MSGAYNVPLPDLVIANGTTDSNIIEDDQFRDADSITFFGPAILPETVTVRIAPVANPQSTDWYDLNRLGVDVVIGPGNAITVELPAFRAMKLVAGVAVAATRTFRVNKGFST